MTALSFEVLGVEPVRFALTPTLGLQLRIAAAGGQRVESVGLNCQIRVEPERRRYRQGEKEALLEVFGEPHQWAGTVRPFLWTQVHTTIGRFEDSTEIALPVECNYDLEVTAGKYFHALAGGEIPLLLLFSGTVFTRGANGLSIQQIPWDREARHRLPVATVRELFDAYHPDAGWLRLQRDTIDAVLAYKGRHALPTWDDAILSLLRAAGEERRPAFFEDAEGQR